MKSEDYPLLYNECSDCADRNQKNHFKVLKIRIGLLVAIAILGGIAWKQLPSVGIIPPLIIAFAFLIMLIFTIIMENKKFEKNWQISRAAAEMIKQESWLYMMRAKSYNIEKGQAAAKVEFVAFLRRIINSKMLPIGELSCNNEGRQISETMDKIRNADFEERKQFYIQNRLADQLRWYARKAKINHTKDGQLTLLMWVFLAMGVAFSFLNVITSIIETSIPLNAVGIATTCSASILSWMGARSYRELTYSYNTVAHELSLIEENAENISSDDQLSGIVEEVEGLMSEEHELWKTKRLVSLK